jgi:hypothetical protein
MVTISKGLGRGFKASWAYISAIFQKTSAISTINGLYILVILVIFKSSW